jgi:maleylpyruvate isomerase
MHSRELDRDVAGAADAHQRLLAHLDESLAADPRQPSLLPGWTIGHVLTHLARNADGCVRMLDGLEQYEGGMKRRAADIEAGAPRRMEELVDDVRSAIWRLEQRWAAPVDWTASAPAASGDVPLDDVPFRRWREVEIHRADLGLGYTFADMPAEYVRLELRRMEMLWSARKPMGMTRLPEPAMLTPPHERLAWLMGRTSIDGLEPPGIY